MIKKLKNLINFAPLLLTALLSVFFVVTPKSNVALAAEDNTGSISVCKIVVDQNNNIVTGADRSGATFTISGFTPSPETSQGAPAGVLPTTTFTTPLNLNTHILSGTNGNDSQCFTYSNLAFGNYYWGTESNSSSGWDSPFYSDQYTGPANSIVNLYSYDNNLFDGNTSNDDARNLNADGHIVLTADRPTRVLIVLNRYKVLNNLPTPSVDLVSPTPTTNSGSSNSNTGGGNNNNGGQNFTTTCNDTAPSSAPVLKSISTGTNSVTLTWSAAGDPVSYYYVDFGTEPGKYIYGNANIGGKGTTSYTINGLSGGVTYYFVVGAGNGCKQGPYSNELSGAANGNTTSSLPAGFTPVVLGAASNAATPTPAAQNSDVKGISTLTNGICARCFWWPILLVEGILLVLLSFLLRKRKMLAISKLIPGILVAVIAYIVFVLVNNGKCPFGVMDLVVVKIPCFYFWVLDLLTFIAISLAFFKKNNK